jgi:hypothetical protein
LDRTYEQKTTECNNFISDFLWSFACYGSRIFFSSPCGESEGQLSTLCSGRAQGEASATGKTPCIFSFDRCALQKQTKTCISASELAQFLIDQVRLAICVAEYTSFNLRCGAEDSDDDGDSDNNGRSYIDDDFFLYNALNKTTYDALAIKQRGIPLFLKKLANLTHDHAGAEISQEAFCVSYAIQPTGQMIFLLGFVCPHAIDANIDEKVSRALAQAATEVVLQPGALVGQQPIPTNPDELMAVTKCRMQENWALFDSLLQFSYIESSKYAAGDGSCSEKRVYPYQQALSVDPCRLDKYLEKKETCVPVSYYQYRTERVPQDYGQKHFILDQIVRASCAMAVGVIKSVDKHKRNRRKREQKKRSKERKREEQHRKLLMRALHPDTDEDCP